MNESRPPFMGALEGELMELFWSGNDGHVKFIHGVLQQRRPITATTINSTLKRLVQKGFVEREKSSRAWFYRARLSRAQFRSMVKRLSLEPLSAPSSLDPGKA